MHPSSYSDLNVYVHRGVRSDPQQPKGSLNAWGLWSMEGLVRYLHLKRASHSGSSTEEFSFWQVMVAGRHERSSRICELNTKPKPLSERHPPIDLTHLNQGWCVQKQGNQSKHDSGPLSTLTKALWGKKEFNTSERNSAHHHEVRQLLTELQHLLSEHIQ